MPTFANTINGNEILAKRAECDYGGNDIQTTYATKAELPTVPVTDVEVDGASVVNQGVAEITMPTVDQTYDSASSNAQSGVAMAGALASKQDAISDLATIRSGAQAGATAVQPADLATVATTGAYSDLTGTPTIPPALSAGNGIDITNDTVSVDLDGTSLTNGANGLSVTLPVPDTTGASQGDVLSVGQNGIEWVTPGGGGDDAVLTYNVSTWSDFTTAYNAGKNIRVVETVDGATYEAVLFEYNPNGSPYGYAKFTATILRTGVGAVSSNWYQISNIDSGVWTRGAGTIQGNFSGQGAISVNSSSHMISLTLDGSSLTQSSSGLAVANPLPSTLGTAGQVLQVNSGATGVEWATPSGGSVTDVEVNGTSVVNASGVAEVTVPTGAQLVPAATSADEDKVLTVDSQGTPAWSTPAAGGVTDVEVDGISVVSQGVASITMPTVDQTYNSASTNAQSGTAVAGAIAGVNQVPASTSSDEGKVLTVDANGDPEWATGGGGTQADWTEDDPTDPSYIENKPTPKTLAAGTGISITENSSTITIAATGGAGVTDVEVDGASVVSGGVASITMPTVDQTYDASSTNAQSGTAVADAIGNLPTNLSSAQLLALKQALGVDETVLWEGSAASSFTVSETISNFEYLRVYMNYNGMNTWCYGTIVSSAQFTIACVGYANSSGDLNRLQMFGGSFTSSNGLAFSSEAGKCIYFANASNTIGGGATSACNIRKIVGVHRIASN